MKHLVFGATGMLGKQIVKELEIRGQEVFSSARKSPHHIVDLCVPQKVFSLIEDLRPDYVWNAAAIVNLELCEKKPCLAYTVNSRAVSEMAQASKKFGAKLVQISTDHYFNNDNASMHTELTPVKLVNEYAHSKFAGEAFALTNSNSLVLRTNITGFRGSTNNLTFAEWVFDVVTNNLPAKLFVDMYTSTLDTRSFCKAAYDLLKNGGYGVINLASSEVSSKKQFIETLAKELNCTLTNTTEESVSSLQPTRANNLGLDVSYAESILGYSLPNLDLVIKNLILEYRGFYEISD